jgi:ABC-type bacteriocin/lantibiotic exporter with double-glycine peptidase domain
MDTLNINNILTKFIGNNKILFLLYFIFTVMLYPVIFIYIPEYYGKVINSFKDNNQSLFVFYLKLLVALYSIEWIIDICISCVTYYITPKFTEYATGTIFEFIIDHYENDFENISMGEILSKIIRLPYILFNYIDVFKNEVLKYAFVFISGFIHFYYVSKLSFITYGIFVIVNYIYIYVLYRLFNKYEALTNKLQDEMYEGLIDCMNNMATIYTFNQEEYEKNRFYTSIFSEYKKILYFTKSIYIKGSIVWGFITISMFIIMNYIMYNDYLKKNINSEKLVSTFIIIFSLIRLFDTAERAAYNLSHIQGQIDDSEGFFNEISKVNKSNKVVNTTFKNGDIIIKNVYHKYDESFVLENICIDIKQGEKIAFVGQIGSGKSTLVKIIMGFQQLKMGQITIGGNSINSIDNKDLRNNIFYIPQKPKLFNRTLYDNIVYGIKKPPSKEEILNILGDLDLHDIKAEFAERMDVKTGIEGNKLSGGQRQIVWLLRAFFRVSRVLIMDEPTASLDPANKQKMIHVIKKLTIGKTLIIVSHDSIDDAFRKVEFKEGKLVSSNYF